MTTSAPVRLIPETKYVEQRVRQELGAALCCDDPKAAAAHVELANLFLKDLTSSVRK